MISYVAQDAGGANLVLHQALNDRSDKALYLFGYASEIANELGLDNWKKREFSDSFEKVVAGANGYAISNPERLLHKFQTSGIPIDGYLDGWDNLGNRFPGIKIRNYLVVDDISEKIAIDLFPGKVLRVENCYLINTLKSLASIRANLDGFTDSVLYLSRPKLNHTKYWPSHGEQCICSDLSLIHLHFRGQRIIVRDHPRLDSRLCIYDFPKENSVELCWSKGTKPLERDLAMSSIVVGAATPALYIAKEAGLTVFATELPKFPGASSIFNFLN
jgi:hypothetical protein